MNNKTRFIAIMLSLAFIPACAGTIMEPGYEVPIDVPCEDGEEFQRTSSNREFVEYTDTSAGYREFGERTPRDQMITQSGAGGNMSAAIPPSIEEEVVDYEEEITSSEGMSSSGGERSSVEDPVEDWLAEEGRSLKDLLTEWSDRAGWRLIWNTNRNYTLNAGAMFRGRFADVSSALIRAFGRASPAPVGTFYKGNRVLVVETMEDENAYE